MASSVSFLFTQRSLRIKLSFMYYTMFSTSDFEFLSPLRSNSGLFCCRHQNSLKNPPNGTKDPFGGWILCKYRVRVSIPYVKRSINIIISVACIVSVLGLQWDDTVQTAAAADNS